MSTSEITADGLERISDEILQCLEQGTPDSQLGMMRQLEEVCPVSLEVLQAMKSAQQSDDEKIYYYWAGVLATIIEMYDVEV